MLWQYHRLISHIEVKPCCVTAIVAPMPLIGLTGAADT